MNHTNDKELLRHLHQVFPEVGGTNSTVRDYAYSICNPLIAILCARVLWPSFIEFQGMIFLEDVIEDETDRSRITEYLEKCGSRSDVERSFNRFYLLDNLFADPKGMATDVEIAELAQIITELWKQRLVALFPLKRFTVDLEEEIGSQPVISVWELR